MKIKKSGSTGIPGGHLSQDETRCSFLLATDYLSFADRAAIWRSYATAVVGLCKDVKELKELIEDGEQLGSMVTELIAVVPPPSTPASTSSRASRAPGIFRSASWAAMRALRDLAFTRSLP